MILLRLIAVLVAATAIAHGVQAFVGGQPGRDPRLLVVEHAVVCVLGLIAAYGLWQTTRWAALGLAIYGVVVAALIVSLGPILALDGPARTGLWTGACAMLLLTALAVWYTRRRTLSSRGA